MRPFDTGRHEKAAASAAMIGMSEAPAQPRESSRHIRGFDRLVLLSSVPCSPQAADAPGRPFEKLMGCLITNTSKLCVQRSSYA